MSTQLILYPQNFKGQYNSTATPSFNEYIVNGISFTGLNSTTLYSTIDNYPSESAIINSPPAILGNWYRYMTTGGAWGTLPPPVVSGGDITMFERQTGTAAHSGVYQQLSGLAIGGTYDVVINISNPTVGILTIEFYTGNNLVYNQAFSSNVAQITTTFTANSTNDIFLLDYESTTALVEIGDISIQESPTTVTNIYSDLFDGQVICDLYQEEDIPLSLSVDDFKNVAEQVKSYSKNFSLPATKRNNQIFNNMFEVTRTDTIRGTIFNPYRKTQCVLKQDGFILFEGYLRLIDVKDKDGEISYNVNLYSEVIALADILKDLTFADLDLSELAHSYNYSEIRNSWQGMLNYLNPSTSGFRTGSTVKYPFIDWNHQFYPDAATGFPILPNLEAAFRPCIKLKYLINKIFAASGFSWTSTLFDSADFDKLYMDFNWGADNAPVVFNSSGNLTKALDFNIPATYTTLPFDEMNYGAGTALAIGGNPLSADFGYSAGVFTAQEDGQVLTVQYNMEFDRSVLVSDTIEVQWLVNGVPVDYATSTLDNFPYSGNFTTGVGSIPTLSAGDTVLCQAKSGLGLYELDGVLDVLNPPATSSLITVTTSVSEMTNETLLETLRGELGQWDFLKGILTMFNLVSMVDENDPNNILIEPYSDIFINNTRSNDLNDQSLSSRFDRKIHDWTEKIDISEMELKPLTDLNKNTIFKFVEDDDDYAFNVYKQAHSGYLYGSKEWDSSGFTILEGTEEIIAEPFAATVSKPLMDVYPDLIVPCIYAMSEDGTSEGFDNSPRIFYDNGVHDLTSCTYKVPAQNGGGVVYFEDEYLRFSHLSTIPSVSSTTTDFVFESQQLIGLGPSPADNLFSLYWEPYFNELYNPDTRTMTLKVTLSPSDISSFKFYDTVFIKNRTFRVNKIQYKPNSLATVEFILI
jgi:hypothetical protein